MLTLDVGKYPSGVRPKVNLKCGCKGGARSSGEGSDASQHASMDSCLECSDGVMHCGIRKSQHTTAVTSKMTNNKGNVAGKPQTGPCLTSAV